MNNSLFETAVGAVVVAIAIGFGAFMYVVGGLGGPAQGYTLKASFGSVDGISVGTDVRMAGIKIGSVTAQRLDLDSYRAELQLAVDTSVKLPEDSTAKIASEGLLGGKFVSLDPGGSDTMIEAGGEIEFTQDAIDIFGLVSQYVLGTGKKTEDTGTSSSSEAQDSTGQDPAATEGTQPATEGEAPAPDSQPADGQDTGTSQSTQ